MQALYVLEVGAVLVWFDDIVEDICMEGFGVEKGFAVRVVD
jgi:hypothetical protein